MSIGKNKFVVTIIVAIAATGVIATTGAAAQLESANPDQASLQDVSDATLSVATQCGTTYGATCGTSVAGCGATTYGTTYGPATTYGTTCGTCAMTVAGACPVARI